jgi:hypothetical protein
MVARHGSCAVNAAARPIVSIDSLALHIDNGLAQRLELDALGFRLWQGLARMTGGTVSCRKARTTFPREYPTLRWRLATNSFAAFLE